MMLANAIRIIGHYKRNENTSTFSKILLTVISGVVETSVFYPNLAMSPTMVLFQAPPSKDKLEITREMRVFWRGMWASLTLAHK